ncbi:hypothetical protein CU097_009322 [Rhizopus azygosporus]|uniref:Uncharacterized protein n=3 Tax=Rhizopus TaxID=4842 RepID=A0A2G4T6E9_RHIZD|nr:uncharacterized protein RHIMIDRAFT_266464 [Rhizopus microsporus ATCC 52813]ORE04441.1 hypothetical protein BCV72DRAFT_294740 [Rhizopus microsporus var. microsporus]PHZ16594.1 hypothetical protein RHIMIDRAFT_266464 [Rhizopus microsporus ATCC 52813]RCH86779.1 hypothetical protein CU097_009322 [Rhizopus azygosporus]CEG63653.1 hypothetical protein RMATCC62417_00765 [Rhizopus microsporus]
MAGTTHTSSIFEDGRRRSSCCNFCQIENTQFNPFDDNNSNHGPLATPPLNSVYLDDVQPFSQIYILNLFMAPDMKRYLIETPLSDDIYQLPVHLQRLVLEARMELKMVKENGAYQRLERVRDFVRSVAGPEDTAAMIQVVNHLVYDDDELSTILGQ